MATKELITQEARQTFANPILNEGTRKIIEAIIAEAVQEEQSKIEKAIAIGEMIVGGVDFEKEGFANYEDYGARLFNWPKSTAYAYRSVGIGLVRGLLPETDANGKRFKFSALHELCNMPDSLERKKLVDDGEVNADDTTEKIRQKVKETKPKKVTKRTEKQYSYYVTTDMVNPVAVTTETTFANDFGTPFHEWTQDSKKYFLFLSEEGNPLVIYRSNQKVVEAK